MKKIMKTVAGLLMAFGLIIVGVFALQADPPTLTTTGNVSFTSKSAYVTVTGSHFVGAEEPDEPTYIGKTYTIEDGRTEAQDAAENWELGSDLVLTEENFTFTVTMTFTNDGAQPVTISIDMPEDIQNDEGATIAAWRGGLEGSGGNFAESILQGDSVTFTYVLELKDARFSFAAEEFAFVVTMTSAAQQT